MKQTNFAKSLWRKNTDLAQTILEHPFLCDLPEGSLSREYFQHYIAQDAFYLESFARAYALAHSPDRRGLDEFSTSSRPSSPASSKNYGCTKATLKGGAWISPGIVPAMPSLHTRSSFWRRRRSEAWV